jgi:hypothetical protein
MFVELPPTTSKLLEVPIEYIYGSTYKFASVWCDLGNYTPYIPDFSLQYSVYYVPPNATFYLANGTALPFTVYPNGQVSIGPYTYPISHLEAPFKYGTYTINFTTLYAGSELTQLNTSVVIPQFKWYYNATTSSIVGADYFVHNNLPYPTYNSTSAVWNIAGYVGPLPSTSADTEVELAFKFTYPALPLKAVEDWNGRPLPNQTIIEYGVSTSPTSLLLCAGTQPIAIDFSGPNGYLLQPLPNGTVTYGSGARIVVYWYDSCLLNKITGGAYPYIDIYDTNIATDVQTLGNAFTATAVETHVIPATIYFVGSTGTGIPGLFVVVEDSQTMGNEFIAYGVTGTDAQYHQWITGYIRQELVNYRTTT